MNIKINIHYIASILMGSTHLDKIYYYNRLEDINNTGGEFYSGPYVWPKIKDFQKESIEHFQNKSLIGYNIERMKKYKERPCLGRRLKIGENEKGEPIFENKFTYFSFNEIYNMCVKFAKNLHEKKEELIHKDTYNNINFNLIGIFAKNCTEWVVSDLGCQMDKITTATLYATLGQDAFKFICHQTNIKTIMVSPDLVTMLCNLKKKFNLAQLTTAILFDMTTNCDNEKKLEELKNAGFISYSFTKDFQKDNNDVSETDLEISEPDTIMTICYTSGTTGNPKGVMLSQRNLMSVLETVIIGGDIPVDEYGAHISFLPLAHIFERMVISGFMGVAGKVGFISGNVRTTLMDDIKYFGPTLLFTVPRVLQTIRNKVFEGFNELPGWKKKLAYLAYNTKLENYKKYGIVTHAIYDKLVFKKIKEMFGNRIRTVLCASAPLRKELADDFKVFLGVPVIEGMGMTEVAGSPFCTNYNDYTNFTAGGVNGGARMILKSVPDLGYSINDMIDGINCPAGEICLKGPVVFHGYYKNDEETKKAFDENGYFHTGDIGRIYPNYGNGLRIVDRVKEIFKLSQGEYIIPAKLESVYSSSIYVQQIMIYGNSTMNNIIAIVVPDKKKCAEDLGITIEELIKDEENEKLIELIIKDFEKLAEEANFNGLEKARYILLNYEGFSIENNCLTPTMKIVRKKVEIKLKERIDKLYDKITQKKK
jgi:long-chain acyl-CoA synthetase